MQKKRIQNRIAESRWTQAWVVSAAMRVWIVAGLHSLTVVAPGALKAFKRGRKAI